MNKVTHLIWVSFILTQRCKTMDCDHGFREKTNIQENGFLVKTEEMFNSQYWKTFLTPEEQS